MGAKIEAIFYTTDEIYRYVTKGTKGPYPIPKAGPGLLAFRSGYARKSKPGMIKSLPGGPYGAKVVMHGQVMHPGIEGSGADETIAHDMEPHFKAIMLEALSRAAVASGHKV
jgi:hypothetical protein